MDTTRNKAGFAHRLHELCDEKGLPARGRLKLVGEQFGVSYQAAKKWLDGNGYPSTETLLEIAQWADVNVNWLLQGVGPKRGDKVDTRALVVAEGIDALPDDHKKEVIEYMRYNFRRSEGWLMEEQRARYSGALDTFEKTKKQ